MPRRFVLHVGLPKTGTTTLQSLLADHRPVLREHGVLYPFVRPAGMFHAAVELREAWQEWGVDPAVARGTWQTVLERARGFDGTTLVSHELLGAASPAQVERVAGSLAGFVVDVVVTARDPARQVPAHWQEQVKNGRTYGLDHTVAQVRDRAVDDDGAGFWSEQDLAAVLQRWAPVAGSASQVHVVTCPPAGADRAALWQRFAAACGVPSEAATTIGADPPARDNATVGWAQAELLRAANLALAGRLAWPDYAQVVKRWFAQGVLSRDTDSPRPVAPADLGPELEEIAARWAEAVTRGGYAVHGALDDLRPRPGPAVTAPHAVPAETGRRSPSCCSRSRGCARPRPRARPLLRRRWHAGSRTGSAAPSAGRLGRHEAAAGRVLLVGAAASGCGSTTSTTTNGTPADTSTSAAPTPTRSSSPSPSHSPSPSPSPSHSTKPTRPLPACARVWRAGADLVSPYTGCTGPGAPAEPRVYACESGVKLYVYQRFYGVPGHRITRAATDLKHDTTFQQVLGSCTG